ncbi:DUF6879 family protein, partial [Saccharopolyspora thermophila]
QADYEARFAGSAGHDSWKLERRQHFREPGNPSWEAFARHDWPEAMRLIQSQREEFSAESEEAERIGVTLFRIRVVAKPFTPYLHWELHLLKARADCGEKIRVLAVEDVAPFESHEALPEILTVGRDTVYEIRYSDDGVLDGAVRHTDLEAATRCKDFLADLYARGEELDRFFWREVAPLPPPVPEGPDVPEES